MYTVIQGMCRLRVGLLLRAEADDAKRLKLFFAVRGSVRQVFWVSSYGYRDLRSVRWQLEGDTRFQGMLATNAMSTNEAPQASLPSRLLNSKSLGVAMSVSLGFRFCGLAAAHYYQVLSLALVHTNHYGLPVGLCGMPAATTACAVQDTGPWAQPSSLSLTLRPKLYLLVASGSWFKRGDEGCQKALDETVLRLRGVQMNTRTKTTKDEVYLGIGCIGHPSMQLASHPSNHTLMACIRIYNLHTYMKLFCRSTCS